MGIYVHERSIGSQNKFFKGRNIKINQSNASQTTNVGNFSPTYDKASMHFTEQTEVIN